MLTTKIKPQLGNIQAGYSVQESYLRMKCPECDKRRSGPCKHPGILNLKGNTK